MWREGLTPELLAWMFNLVALLFGGALGARALINPHWAQRFVRLQPDAQGGGFSEFRATYGGVFLGLHAVAWALSALWVVEGDFQIGLCALGAGAALAAGWGGSAFGRTLSMWRDGTRTGFNTVSAIVEAALALAIVSPWLFWTFQPAS